MSQSKSRKSCYVFALHCYYFVCSFLPSYLSLSLSSLSYTIINSSILHFPVHRTELSHRHVGHILSQENFGNNIRYTNPASSDGKMADYKLDGRDRFQRRECKDDSLLEYSACSVIEVD
jgi:hypothetical protein